MWGGKEPGSRGRKDHFSNANPRHSPQRAHVFYGHFTDVETEAQLKGALTLDRPSTALCASPELTQGTVAVTVVPCLQRPPGGRFTGVNACNTAKEVRVEPPEALGVALVSPFQAGLGVAALELCSLCRPPACLGTATSLLLSLGKDYFFFFPIQPPKGSLGTAGLSPGLWPRRWPSPRQRPQKSS